MYKASKRQQEKEKEENTDESMRAGSDTRFYAILPTSDPPETNKGDSEEKRKIPQYEMENEQKNGVAHDEDRTKMKRITFSGKEDGKVREEEDEKEEKDKMGTGKEGLTKDASATRKPRGSIIALAMNPATNVATYLSTKVMDTTKITRKQIRDDMEATKKKVKDKTVSVGSHVKDATVGASQWVANTTSKTAKAALDQAKSGLSIGEKVTLFAVEKISAWSRKGFTQSFMLVVLILYTALGALLFIAIEEPHETKEKLDIEKEKMIFLQKVYEESRAVSTFSDFNETGHDLISVYEKQLYKSYSHGVTSDDNKVWTFWKAMFFCSTISTTIGYGHIAPSTNAGRALTIIYAIVGIPLFLILLADFGKLFTRILKSIFVFLRRVYRSATCRRVRKKKPVQPQTPAEAEAGTEEAKKLCSQSQQQQDKQKAWDEKTGGGGGGGGGGGEGEGGGGTAPALTELEDDSCCGSCLRRIRACFSWICCRDREADAGDTANGPAPTPQDDEQFAVDDTFNLPVSLALIILLIYILFGCIFYTMWEDWTYFEAFYFIFISMTTIGFGDYVPKHPAFMMATTLYLLFGLALTAMSINIIQEKLSDTFRTATKKLKESFAYIMAATQGEEGVEGEEDQDGEKPKEVEVAEVHGKEDKKES